MYITKTLTATNGAILNFHKISSVNITETGVTAVVRSFTTDAFAVLGWEQQIQFPTTIFTTTNPVLDVAAALIAAGGYLETGYVNSTDPADPTASLADQKDAKWITAKAYRDTIASGTCTEPLGVVDIDPDSQRKINGATTAAIIANTMQQPFSVDWTMHDNSVVAHNAAAMITMGVTVMQFLAACQAAGTAIRTAIDAATDQTSLDAIDITAGYPS